MTSSYLHKQYGNKAVLLLILMVAVIVGLAYWFKSSLGTEIIAEVKSWIQPDSASEATPNRSASPELSNYFSDKEPKQGFFDQGTTYVKPIPVQHKKYVPERVRNGKTPQPQVEGSTNTGFGYDVQLVSTRNEAAAHELMNLLRRDGFASFVESVWRGNVRMFRVKIGHYRHRADANNTRDIVRRRYPERFSTAIVISTDK